ncbi:MAG: CpaF family protein, partial [Asticcacaulis sp.]
MFGKRQNPSSAAASASAAPLAARKAPPPAAPGAEISTRPQHLDANASPTPLSSKAAPPLSDLPQIQDLNPTPTKGDGERPRMTEALAQLTKAQNAVTEIVKEHSDYYHATKTAIFNALLNTIDLAQLAQLDHKSASEEIRD